MIERKTIAIVLSLIMLASAGCAGWGDDGPADDAEPESDGNGEAQEDVDGPESDTDDAGGASTDDEGEDTEPTESSETDDTDETVGEGDDAPPESGDDDTEVPPGDDDDDGDAPGNGDDDDDNGEAPGNGNGDDDDDNGENDEETFTLTVEVGHDTTVTLERLSDGATAEREASDGTVEFEVLEGDYIVNADGHHEMHPEDYVVQVDEDTAVGLQSTEADPIEVTVVDVETGDPVEGATVDGVCNWWYSSGDNLMDATTDGDGVATIDALTPTSCDAGISADGYEDKSMQLDVPGDDGQTFELEPDEAETVETTIQVYDEDQNHFEGASVAVGDIDYGETDEHGVFTFDMPEDEVSSYDIGADGYDNPSGTIEPGDHEEVELNPIPDENDGQLAVA